MNYFCFMCNKEFKTVNFTIHHLKNEHFLKEKENTTFRCISSNQCSNQFCTYSGLRKHANKCTNLKINNYLLTSQSNTTCDRDKDGNILRTPSKDISEINYQVNMENHLYKERIENSTSEFFNNLETINISEKNVNLIQNNLKEFWKKVSGVFKTHLLETDKKRENSFTFSDFTTFDEYVCCEIDKYKTTYKRRKLLESDPYYVEPIPKPIGGRWEKKLNRVTRTYQKHFVQCTFQYVPVLETLKSLFKNTIFKEEFLKSHHTCDTEVYQNFCCASIFKNNDFFISQIPVIQLQLFFDEFEVVNPLGSKTSIHKIGAIYMTIRNFENNSKLYNIYVVALFFSQDLRNEFISFNNILKPIVEDIKILEESGIEIGNILIKGTLCTFSFDNLGANTCFGFVESFRANYFCRICEMHREETQKVIKEDLKKLRSATEYNLKFLNNKKLIFTNFCESKGIKRYCILNELKHFHTLVNYNVDVMHDVLEGSVPFVLKHFFKHIIQSNILQLEEINNRIKSFNYGFLYQKCLPPSIDIDKPGTTIGLTASQTLCLILHFPFIFYDIQPKAVEHWKSVISVIQIVNIVISKKIPKMYIKILENTIHIHLKCILEVYKLPLIPKHHILLHYPGIIEKIGPLVHTWTMRYEAKHRYFNTINSVTGNYINVCKTLAYRHQKMISQKIKEMTFHTELKFGKLTEVVPNNFKYFEKLRDYIHDNNIFYSTKHIEVNSELCYRIGAFICLTKNGNFFTFGLIKNIIYIENEFIFLCEKYETKNFNEILNSNQIEKLDTIVTLKISELVFKRPYEAYYVKEKTYILVPNIIA